MNDSLIGAKNGALRNPSIHFSLIWQFVDALIDSERFSEWVIDSFVDSLRDSDIGSSMHSLPRRLIRRLND